MITKKNYLWENGQIISIGFTSGSYKAISQVKTFAQEVLQHTNLKFLWFTDTSGAYSTNIRIALDDNSYAPHAVHCAQGIEALLYPVKTPTMVLNSFSRYMEKVAEFTEMLQRPLTEAEKQRRYTKDYIENYQIPHYLNLAKSVVHHEFMHMLGISHEQRHPDSGIIWENPERWVDDGKRNDYDIHSVMHYPYDQYKKYIEENHQEDLPNTDFMNSYRFELSKGDIAGLKQLYPKKRNPQGVPAQWLTMFTGVSATPKQVNA